MGVTVGSLRHALAASVFAVIPCVVAAEVTLPIANGSGLTLMEVYASPSGEDLWGEDLLYVHVLRDGEARVVTIPGGAAGCSFDLRLVFEDGREVLDSADVCGSAGLRLAPLSP